MANRKKSGGDYSREDIAPKAYFQSKTAVINGVSASKSESTRLCDDGDFRLKPKKLTPAQVKVQKLLSEMVEKTIDFVKDPAHVPEEKPENDCGVRLFKRSSTGIICDHVDKIERQKTQPNSVPDRGVEDICKEIKKRIKSIALDESDVLAIPPESYPQNNGAVEKREVYGHDVGIANQEIGGEVSSSDDEDPKWKAAIQSIATTTVYGVSATKPAATRSNEDGDFRSKPKKLTHGQLKVQKLLNEIVEKTLDFVKDPVHVPEDKSENDSGVRLFKRCSTGIIFDHKDELEGPKKKPNLLQKRGHEDNPKELKKRIKSIAVDGFDVLAAAKEAANKSSARLAAIEAAAKAKAKKEEERIAELKSIRGEKWLPSVARQLQINKNSTWKSAIS